ncbi:MAG: hypothetical protein AAGL49_05360, partial [Pseudomonadota bacterium]
TDVAERLVQSALHWLARSAYRRGEAQAAEGQEDDATFGLFVLAGRRFAHEEIGYFGPIDILAIYDPEALRQAGVAAPERTFMRIGTELRQALEGPPSERPLYAATAPAVTGLAGAPLICGVSEARAAMEAEESAPLQAWFATARVVAGDRRAGGAFLESIAEELWEGETTADGVRAGASDPSFAHDPDAAFERLAQISRLALGRKRPLFRTASTRTVFETMGEVGAIPKGQAERLAVASDLAQMARSRLQLISGGPAKAASDEKETEALAALCGYTERFAFEAALAGARAEAKSTLSAVEAQAADEAGLNVESESETPYDVGKLEELGFRDGFAITGLIDQWIGVHAGPGEAAPRFSELAPGLLTAFGESQRPERAAQLFDALLNAAPAEVDVFAELRAREGLQSTLVDYFGVLDGYAQDLAVTASGAAEVLEARGEETPQSAEEWLSRFAPAWSGAAEAPALEDVRDWAAENAGRCALYLAGGDISFDAAPRILAAVSETALQAVFSVCATSAAGQEAEAAGRVCLVAAGDLGAGQTAPGAPLRVFFVSDDGVDPSAAEAFVKRFAAAVDGGDEAGALFELDMTCRPGGVSSPLATPLAEFRNFFQSGAVAVEQLLLTGMRPSAGGDEIRAKVGQSIFDLATRPRKADLILRDADRARARQSRQDRARSPWDVRRISGGLDDIDLIIGALRVKHGGSHAYVLGADPDECLDAMARASLIDSQHASELAETRAFWLRIAAAQAFANWSDPESEPIGPRLAGLLARAAGVDDIAHVHPLMRGHADRANVLYNHLVLGRERPMDAPLRTAV